MAERDSDTLALHYREAGEWERAGDYAQMAADQAAAARSLRPARGPPLPPRPRVQTAQRQGPRRAQRPPRRRARQRWPRRQGGLVSYLEAAASSPPARALELRRRAGEQFLRAGQLPEGMPTIRQVLAAAGMSLPATSRALHTGLAWERTRWRLRGCSACASATPEDVDPDDPRAPRGVPHVVVEPVGARPPADRAVSSPLSQPGLQDRAGIFHAACALAAEVAFVSSGGEARPRPHPKLASAAQALLQRTPRRCRAAFGAVARGRGVPLGRWRQSIVLLEQVGADPARRVHRHQLRDRVRPVAPPDRPLPARRPAPGRPAPGHVHRRGPRPRRQLVRRAAARRPAGRLLAGRGRPAARPRRDRLRPAAPAERVARPAAPGGPSSAACWSTSTATTRPRRGAASSASSPTSRLSLLFHSQWAHVVLGFLRSAQAALLRLVSDHGDSERAGLVRLVEHEASRLALETAPWARPLGELVGAGLAAIQGQRERALAGTARRRAGPARRRHGPVRRRRPPPPRRAHRRGEGRGAGRRRRQRPRRTGRPPPRPHDPRPPARLPRPLTTCTHGHARTGMSSGV